MSIHPQNIDQTPEFKELAARRWTVAIILDDYQDSSGNSSLL